MLLCRRGDHRSRSGTVVHASEIQIAGREKDFARRIDPLPDHIENVAAGPRGQGERHKVIHAVEGSRLSARNLDKVRPAQRLERIISLAGQVGFEVAGLMRGGGIEPAEPGSGHDRSRWPVGASEVQSRILVAPDSREFSVRDLGLVVVVGCPKVHLVPVVECLGACDGDGRAGGIGIRRLRIFQEDFIRTADRICHGAMAERGECRHEQDRKR